MKPLVRLALVVMVVGFVASMGLVMYLGLPAQDIADGAAIFAIAFIAAIAGIVVFVRSNAQNIEDAVRRRDRGALWRTVLGARKPPRR